MAEQSSDTTEQSPEYHWNWDKSAAGWAKFFDKFERGAQCVIDRMIELARIQPGHRVLDVATGIGEPAVAAARRVAPNGYVVATDSAPQMIKLARERAAAMGADLIEFREMDAQAPDLPESSFDAILCRWGLMFLHDLAGALERMRRLLVPGGRIVAAVWSDAPRVPMIGLMMDVCRRFDLPRLPPGTLGPLSLADTAALKRAFEAAGFADVESTSLTVTFEFASGDEYALFQQRVLNPTVELIRAQPAETQAKIWRSLADSARPYLGADGVVRLPNECVCVAARR